MLSNFFSKVLNIEKHRGLVVTSATSLPSTNFFKGLKLLHNKQLKELPYIGIRRISKGLLKYK